MIDPETKDWMPPPDVHRVRALINELNETVLRLEGAGIEVQLRVIPIREKNPFRDPDMKPESDFLRARIKKVV